MPPENPSPNDKNRHIEDYLSYYFSLAHPPHFAVMISGAWGIGKTFLVKRFLKNIPPEKKFIYVSLYGLSTVDEFDDALFQAMYPALGWQITKIGARLTKTLLKHVGFDPGFKVTDVINRFSADLYVFDDLERCVAPLKVSLGYVNSFVEHDDCKVIVIANEGELPSGDDYRKWREKLIGKTLEVQSAFAEAFKHFVDQIDFTPARILFEQSAVEIGTIYGQSGLNNLRILQQTMWDFERLFKVLTDTHRQNTQAMSVLLNLFFALSFEFKAGHIGAADLTPRRNRLIEAMAERNNANSTAFGAASHRYPDIDLSDTIISDDILIDVLVKGIVNAEAIISSLDQSRFFVARYGEPPWRTVWHWFERPDDEVLAAADKMERQYAAREFSNTGELLHVFGLRLFLSDISILKLTRAEVVSDGKHYIDDLYTQHRLELPQLASFPNEVFFGGYAGLAIQENETAEFKELSAYLEHKRKRALEESYPRMAENLLREMQSDPHLYFRRLCLTDSKENLYYDIPILASLDPNEFVSVLLKMHPSSQRIVMIAFQSRYERGGLTNVLAAERSWLERVYVLLLENANKMPPISKYRLTKIVEGSIAPALKAAALVYQETHAE